MRKSVKALRLVVKAVLALVCLVMVIPSVIHLCPSIIGADESYIVLGGSMKPALRPGDLAFTVKVTPAEVEVGDIVVVRSDDRVYMHRLVEKEEALFRLKGDANEDPDSSYVNCSDIIGKTVFSLPMGYIYTKNGYALIVATPLMVLAAYQAVKIYRLYDTRKRRRRGLKAILLGKGGRRRRKISVFDMTSALLLITLVAGGTYMMAPYFISGSMGFFTDTEYASRDIIRAATWKVDSIISCSANSTTVNMNESVTVHGSIKPARSGVTVKLTYEWNDTTTTTTVSTLADGAYEDIFTPNEVGSWTIKASWKGDDSYFGASSNIITLLVVMEE